MLRLVAGTVADRTQRHWTLTLVGYGLTALCVPLLAVAPSLGAAASQVGRGKGFGVHKALDQVGAFAGPLVVAGVTAVASVRAGLAVLAIPGAVAMVLLVLTRRRLDTPGLAEEPPAPATAPQPATTPQPVTTPQPGADRRPRVRLPARFHAFALAVALTTAGLLTFGLFGYHLVEANLVSTPMVPVVYAGAMAVAAIAALVAGEAFDRFGGTTLRWLPPLVAPVPALVFTDDLALALLGIALWGAATGIQDSTVKALVADLVPRRNLGTAYGVFAAYQGVAALAGGAIAGALYADHRTALAVGTVTAMAVAYVPLWWALRDAD